MKVLILAIMLMSPYSFAASYSGNSGETWSVGLLGGLVTANESDINSLITRANTSVGVSTPQMSNAYEFGGYIQRRFNGSNIALQIRPLYFTDSTSGSANNGSGSYNFSLTGYSIFPLLKFYLLEDKSIKLYLLGGVGYGLLNGNIQEGSANVKFSGSQQGFQGGLGVDFCFGSKDQHCLFVEGNGRYLYVNRMTTDSTSGSFPAGSLSQVTNGQELEVDNHDFSATMSGIQGFLGYHYNF